MHCSLVPHSLNCFRNLWTNLDKWGLCLIKYSKVTLIVFINCSDVIVLNRSQAESRIKLFSLWNEQSLTATCISLSDQEVVGREYTSYLVLGSEDQHFQCYSFSSMLRQQKGIKEGIDQISARVSSLRPMELCFAAQRGTLVNASEPPSCGRVGS